MSFYFVTGKLGNGKTLVSVSRIKERILKGCPVATNIDINLQAMLGKMAKDVRLIRMPDKPTLFDFESIGIGNTSYDESKNGLIVLDECGTWFNARNWQDKTRQAVNNYLLHVRKLGWDVILIVQDISIVDSQAREALSEFTAFCKRMDNFQIPLLGGLYKLIFGSKLKLPRIHAARVVYGSSQTDMLSDRWVYRGTDLYSAYDTKQCFSSDYPHGAHSILPPFYLNRRTYSPRNLAFIMRITKIYLKRFHFSVFLFLGLFIGLASSFFITKHLNNEFYTDYVRLKQALENTKNLSVSTPQAVVDDIFTDVKGFKIVGSQNYSGRFIYDLVWDDVHISSNQLSDKYTQKQVSDCQLRLLVGRQYHDIYCY